MSPTQCKRHTNDDSHQYEPQRLAKDLPKNVPLLRAQRQANSDVPRPAGLPYSHQAIEANGGEEQSQQAESAGELLDEAVGLQGVVDQPRHRAHLDGWKRGSCFPDNLAKRSSHSLRIGIRAHFIEGGRISHMGLARGA